MMTSRSINRLSVVIPEHIPQVRSIGFACGMNSGIISLLYDGGMPPVAPVQIRGSIVTNDSAGFAHAFREGHDQGFNFGAQASDELAKVLNDLPLDDWWPICICFAGWVMGVDDEGELYSQSPNIREGTDEFCRIYVEHFPQETRPWPKSLYSV